MLMQFLFNDVLKYKFIHDFFTIVDELIAQIYLLGAMGGGKARGLRSSPVAT